MRLLHTGTLKFQDFAESTLPPYAILSHTWDESEEVSLQDMISPYQSTKRGYVKITETCRLARSQGLDYAWIDTCCIDKTSSAELTESINSMFRWYHKASVCFVYLSDLHTAVAGPEMAQCAWFSRGWTLQELLAPSTLGFYNSSWIMVGTKAQLEKDVSDITRIPATAIRGIIPLKSFSVAQKMSWASQRVTTRTEDVAYCLLGLFDIHMPLIYGEGSRAFRRLQEEISTQASDLTLFSWVPAETAPGYCSMLASSPSEFEHCVEITAYMLLEPLPRHDDDDDLTYRYILPLGYRLTTGLSHISIHIRKYGPALFVRETEPTLHEVSVEAMAKSPLLNSAVETFYVSINLDTSITRNGSLDPNYIPRGIYMPSQNNIEINTSNSPVSWDARTRICFWPQSSNDVMALPFVASVGRHRIQFGLLLDFRGRWVYPACRLIDQESTSSTLFFLVFIRTPNQLMNWADVGFKLPEIQGLTNSLRVEVAGKPYEITASVGNRDVKVDSEAVNLPTLYMDIKEVSGAGPNADGESVGCQVSSTANAKL
ncbi:heterokaryon incompatibility protein-domain-containing protein [Coniochaeta sp. 2T2.1]|nr:heterokaryon incompatibility protein-domain-containing protein [Coniochaeta sp. 2T2.1]